MRLGWETRLAKQRIATARLNPTVEEVVKYLLFAEEMKLKAPIEGWSAATSAISPPPGAISASSISRRACSATLQLQIHPAL